VPLPDRAFARDELLVAVGLGRAAGAFASAPLPGVLDGGSRCFGASVRSGYCCQRCRAVGLGLGLWCSLAMAEPVTTPTNVAAAHAAAKARRITGRIVRRSVPPTAERRFRCNFVAAAAAASAEVPQIAGR
jgi:hypothetical protein